jgi:hypothetical protein
MTEWRDANGAILCQKKQNTSQRKPSKIEAREMCGHLDFQLFATYRPRSNSAYVALNFSPFFTSPGRVGCPFSRRL